ncbi:MAG: metallophosphoesterase [Clostridia bacterium]|nr:metallophosphoesterase [Clostridia bacterium]
MKHVEHVNDIYTSESDNIYLADNGLYIRDVCIGADIDDEVVIGHISDIHLNYCNQQDFDEADPVLMSTYENRVWCANGETVPKLRRCLEFLKDTDLIVANGDTMDYLSHGTMELMQKELWDKVADVIATVGGHEIAVKMQGEVDEVLTRDERIEIIKKYWKHDIYYVSRLVKNKVLVIGMLNDNATCTAEQKLKLEADLDLARKKGYAVLIFAHEAFATNNPKYKSVTFDDILNPGDAGGFPRDFCTGEGNGMKLAGNHESDADTKAVYNLIVNSADVIKAVVVGHYHNDMYNEITAKYPDGTDTVIPQYLHTASAYDDGHVMRIIIK